MSPFQFFFAHRSSSGRERSLEPLSRGWAVTLLLLLFYALSYSIWGLVTLVLWERRAETRQVFIRCFFFCLVIFSALFYLPVNPVAFLLAYLGRQELTPLSMAGWKVSASIVHVTFHLLIGMHRFGGVPLGAEEGLDRLSTEAETLRKKLSELMSWERRKRREQILAGIFFYALLAALLTLPFHPLLPMAD